VLWEIAQANAAQRKDKWQSSNAQWLNTSLPGAKLVI
jgi:hypothetical protein